MSTNLQCEHCDPDTSSEQRESDNGNHRYDLVVIGSGGAGMAAAITGVREGARVLMVERGTIGGTCVNIGCVPSKNLLRASEIYHQAGHHPFAGIETSAGRVDLAALVQQKDSLLDSLRRQKYLDLIEEYGWELARGEARFADEETLEVGQRRIKAQAFIVATGAAPAVPPIPGLLQAGYLTSTEALSLTEVPSSLFTIGAGYIALELGQLFNRLGTRVTMAQRGPALLDEYEPEIGQTMGKVLRSQGIEVITGAHIERVQGGPEGRRVHLNVDGTGEVREVSHVLVAAGRAPNTASLNLQAAGVQVDERGAIKVNEQLQSTNPRVWAAGDVTLGPQFVYVAAYEGKLAAENALKRTERMLDFTALPAVIFTHPQVAIVGLSEAEARATGLRVNTTTLPLDVVPRARVNYETTGLVKMVADKRTGRILGVHMVAENAGDVIYSGVLAVKYGLTIHDLIDTFAPYLTMAESLKLAAQSFEQDVHSLSCCAA